MLFFSTYKITNKGVFVIFHDVYSKFYTKKHKNKIFKRIFNSLAWNDYFLKDITAKKPARESMIGLQEMPKRLNFPE